MTDTSPADDRILGSLRTEDGRGVVHMEDTYATDIQDLWSALTEPARLKRWIAEVEGDIAVGGEFRARFTSGWEGTGSVVVCDAPHRLLVTTHSTEDDATTMEATLTADGDRTHLVIEERGLPLNEYAAHGSGWQAHVEDLAAYLAGDEPADWSDRWRELTPTYERMAEQVS